MTDGAATRFTLRVASGPDAPASGRLFLAATLRTVGVDETAIDDAKLAVSELVTSAVTTARTDAIEISIDCRRLDVVVTPLEASDLDDTAHLIVSSLFVTTPHGDGLGFCLSDRAS